MSYKFFMSFKGWGQKNDISVCEPIAEMQFIISSEDEIKVETFDGGIAESSDKARVGSMIDFSTKFLIFLNNLASNYSNVDHL